MGHCGFVDASAGERVVHVGEGNDAGGDGDRFAAESIGVAGAVPAFVVVAGGDLGPPICVGGNRRRCGREFSSSTRVTEVGVALDDSAFAIGEATGLAEDGVGDTDLADVVHGTGDAEGLDPFFIDEGGGARDISRARRGAIDADAFQVGAGIGVTVFGELGEAEDEGVAGENLDLRLRSLSSRTATSTASADTSGDLSAGDGDHGEHDGVGEVDGEARCVVAV